MFDLLEKAVDSAIASGAKYSDARILNSKSRSINARNGDIEDFNEEFQGIMGELKDSSERRHQILHDLMEGNTVSKAKVKKPAESVDDRASDINQEAPSTEMSEWEKKLEGLA